uniref:Uncharacterized protein n=1 Tax=Panagrolaimus sp. PS1159 TaxID=55785 RepID=A0AC35GM04_9BILA
MNPKHAPPFPPIATNQHVITTFGFAAKMPKSSPCPDFTCNIFSKLPRTCLSANEVLRLHKLIRSMTDEIEGHVNKIAEDQTKCNADKYAQLALACKQIEFLVRCAFDDFNTDNVKELSQMLRLYNHKPFSFKM